MHPAIIPTLAYPTVRHRVACPPFTMCSRTLPFITVLAYPATRRYACILHYPSPKLSHASSSSPGAEAALLRPYGSQCRIYPQSLGAAHIMVHTHDVSWAWEKKRTTERVGDDIAGQNGCGPRRGDGRVLDVGRGHGRLLGLVAYRLEIAREVMNRTLEVSSPNPTSLATCEAANPAIRRCRMRFFHVGHPPPRLSRAHPQLIAARPRLGLTWTLNESLLITPSPLTADLRPLSPTPQCIRKCDEPLQLRHPACGTAYLSHTPPRETPGRRMTRKQDGRMRHRPGRDRQQYDVAMG
ncbi:hypothetical protein BD779DRAFT_1794839 [Infundibulicybe gibba]|nr:hypothetical protein BD779DRAFT_1794839 [Infundibulicybe gibba]